MTKCHEIFHFRQFRLCQDYAPLKITTDSILLGAWASGEYGTQNILDIGTGTGVIALMLAQKFPEAFIEAVEKDTISYEVARKNFMASPFKKRLSLHLTDIRAFNPEKSYDVIVSNPPFFEQHKQQEKLNPSRHKSSLPLSCLMTFVRKFLSAKGIFYMIYPSEYEWDVLTNAYENNLFVKEKILISDNQNLPVKRILWSFVCYPTRVYNEKTTYLFEKNGTPSVFYKNLTKNYLINL